MTATEALRTYLRRTDVLLSGLGLAGLVLFVVLVPGVHPDAPVRYTLTAEEAVEEATAFLEAGGSTINDLTGRATLRRDDELLTQLRREQAPAFRRWAEERGDSWPFHYWHVRFVPEGSPDLTEGRAAGHVEDAGDEAVYTVRLTLDGVAWDVKRADVTSEEVPRVDRDAFSAVFAEQDETTLDATPRVTELPDSVLDSAFDFDVDDTLRPDISARPAELEGALMRQFVAMRDEMGRSLGLDVDSLALTNTLRRGDKSRSFISDLPEGSAVALAAYHLRRSAWDASAFRVDSVWVKPRTSERRATVRFMRRDSLLGMPVRVDVTVASGGALNALDAKVGDTYETPIVTNVSRGLVVGVYVLLSLILIVVFFKRLGAHLIDGRAAGIDGVVLGLVMFATIILTKGFDPSSGIETPWIVLGVKVLVGLFVGLITGLYVSALSGAVDSVTRAVWAKKIYAASLLRMGDVRNVFVGSALVRGLSLAGILLGLTVLLQVLLPESSVRVGRDELLVDVSYEPATYLIAQAAFESFLSLLFVLLGIGVAAYRVRARPAFVIGAVVVASAMVHLSPASLEPAWTGWVASGLCGLVLGWAFWRFDFVTCFAALFVSQFVWDSAEAWVIPGSPVLLHGLLVAAMVVGLLMLGVLGLVSGRTRREVGDYVPAYVEELTRQERLKRELEIARQVQDSFLPEHMPNVEGVDIAAMCLAANEVGGDYYDFVELGDGRLAVVVGDVSGKGIQAAFFMTLTKGILRTLCREEHSPAEVLRRLNTLFCENAPRGTFISMIFGVLDVKARRFTFARAGHNPVILQRSPNQVPDLVQPAGLAIGLTPGARFDETIEETTLNVRAGDVLVFYTDGFSEAMNRAKELYSDKRLAERVGQVGQRGAAEILRAVSEDVHHFMEGAGRHDDMTMVVVKLGQPTGAASAHPAALNEPSAVS